MHEFSDIINISFCLNIHRISTYVQKRYTSVIIYHVSQKKLHHVIFAIALSKLYLLRQLLAHIYFN